MAEKFSDTDKTFCSILLDVISAKGVADVVCSPGSRNTPLVIASAVRKNLRKHVVADERCAAFMALGMALVSQKPVALICTSGTALLNYAPAVAEAFYQGVPLIVLSADRPQQWIDQDDSQTLRQFEALSNFVKKSYEIPAWGDSDPELQWYANRIANDAMIEACSRRPGPVHINVRLAEPLGRKLERMAESPRVIDILSADTVANKEVIKGLAEEVARSKVMLVAGFLPPDSRLHKSVAEFCSLPNVTAMTETLSNLHIDDNATSIDSVLTWLPSEKLDAHAPDLVISLGGSLVSRKLKEYLRVNKGRCHHWSLGLSHTTSDCFMSLSKRIELEPSRFLHHLASAVAKVQKNSGENEAAGYSSNWRILREKALAAKEVFISSAPWSELKAFSILSDKLPREANLFLSNGTSVRYAQIVNGRRPHASYCNRGVSGIDGCTSTAVGGACAYKGMTVFVTGDLSMAYDIGALALREAPDRMKIVVIDNQGGGIFRFIPTTSELDEREEYFCASPILPLRHLAEGYGWEYYEASCEASLRSGLDSLFSSPAKGIIRVVCDGEKSASLLRQYMQIKSEI